MIGTSGNRGAVLVRAWRAVVAAACMLAVSAAQGVPLEREELLVTIDGDPVPTRELGDLHGTLPFLNWNGANHCRNARASSSWPRRSSAAEASAPSRIHERAYEREPGWIPGPSRLISV